mgnify:CR=1 FL=1
MKRLCLSVIILISLCCFAFSETYYVKKGGSDENPGLSWENAFQTVARSMDEVTSVDAVWVAEGVLLQTELDKSTSMISNKLSCEGGNSDDSKTKKKILKLAPFESDPKPCDPEP